MVDASPWLLDIVEEHFEELQTLWSLRLGVVESPEWFEPDLAKLDARIAAHADALVLSIDHAIELFQAALAGEREQAFSACFPLIFSNLQNNRQWVLDSLRGCKGPGLDGFADALCHTPGIDGWSGELKSMAAGNDPPAMVAGLVLRFRGSADGDARAVEWLRQSTDPFDVLRSWTMLCHGDRAPLAETDLERAWSDGDPELAKLAAYAALWSKQDWFVPYCRQCCQSPHPGRPQAARVLSVLGLPQDLGLVRTLIQDPSLGPDRCKLASSLGHPSLIPLLCEIMESSDAAAAGSAGLAFLRLTGVDVSTGKRVTTAPAPATEPDDPDTDAALADEVLLPDASLAKRVSQEQQKDWEGWTRMHRGLQADDVSQVLGNNGVDLEAQMEAALRSRYLGVGKSSYASRLSTRSRWLVSGLA
jgi:hypothetical protein